MSLLAEGQAWWIVEADCREALPRIATASIDSVVTDPPYELGFMGKTWDASGIAYSVDLWREVLRVLKPGGHLLSFGGTRTYHRMTCAIEDAGFEIRDSLHWMYGTGFPKSLNVSKAIDATTLTGSSSFSAMADVEDGKGVRLAGEDNSFISYGAEGSRQGKLRHGARREKSESITDAAKQWDGWGTALKPGHEPIVLARKPLIGTVAQNVQAFGTGGLNIDGCRLSGDGYSQGGQNRSVAFGANGIGEKQPRCDGSQGRWPANVLLDPDAAAELDAQSGERPGMPKTSKRRGNSVKGYNLGSITDDASMSPGYGDSGGASRFFYVAKPDRTQRDLGCGDLEAATGGEATGREDGSAGLGPRAGAGRTGGARNIHPTVKPVELMQHLVRLVTPPGGVVLDPFTGSGATGAACRFEDLRFIGIEREPEYAAIARLRIERAHKAAPVTRSIERAADMDPRQTSIFDALKVAP